MSPIRAASDPARRLRLVRATAAEAPAADDARLLRGLIEGQAWAATTTWHRYAPMVYRLFGRALGQTTDCEDLTQDVFAGVFAAVRRVRDPEAFRSFIYSCAVRRLRSHLRGKRLRSLFPLFGPDQLPEHTMPGADLDGREVLARFYRALDKLTAEDRTAYTLRYLEGLSLAEIAAATGVSLATVKRRIARSVERVADFARRDPLLSGYVVSVGGHDAG